MIYLDDIKWMHRYCVKYSQVQTHLTWWLGICVFLREKEL